MENIIVFLIVVVIGGIFYLMARQTKKVREEMFAEMDASESSDTYSEPEPVQEIAPDPAPIAAPAPVQTKTTVPDGQAQKTESSAKTGNAKKKRRGRPSKPKGQA